MPISYTFTGSFDNDVYTVLKQTEAKNDPGLVPYYDSVSNPTIGIGINISNANYANFVVRVLGFFENPIDDSVDTSYFNQIMQILKGPDVGAAELDLQLNAKMMERANVLGIAPTPFAFSSEAQAKIVFDEILPDKEEIISNLLPTVAPDSLERVALLSLAWNEKPNAASALIGPNLIHDKWKFGVRVETSAGCRFRKCGQRSNAEFRGHHT